jgi:membrane protein DedA with SNARE-associated domain
MPESVQALIDSYGYAVLFIGTVLEGETVLVLGGAAARLGHLRLEWVVACAFAGSLLGDQLWFWIGRRYGARLLARRPAWQPGVARVHARLARYEVPLLVGFRFVYGIRNLTPFVVGMSRIGAVKFAVLNALGALLWAVAGAALGYALAHAADALLGDLKRFELYLFAAIITVGLGLWGYRAASLQSRRRAAKAERRRAC